MYNGDTTPTKDTINIEGCTFHGQLDTYHNDAATTPPETDENPAIGANDFVGAAAALAVVFFLGMAALTRKNRTSHFQQKSSPAGELFC